MTRQVIWTGQPPKDRFNMTQAPANAIRLANEIGQSIWLDSISRDLIRSGELARLFAMGVSGVTSNPTIFEKAVAEGASYDDALLLHSEAGGGAGAVFEELAVEDIRDTADLLQGTYASTRSKDGYVSIEVNPLLARDTEGTVDEARRLFESIGRPNVMIKVPGTPEGMPAVRTLIGSGINVNVTLLFSLHAYMAAAQAYINGLRDYVSGGGDAPDRIASVASFFVSRVDTSVDGQLDEVAAGNPSADVDDLYGNIGIANARMAYGEFQRLFGETEFGDLLARGAQFQRPLWASTSVKNPDYSDTMYVDGLMGPHTVNTLPEATLTAMLEHGDLEDRLTGTAEIAREQVESLDGLGISLDSITDNLLSAGVDAFADSYSGLLDRIDAKLDMFAGARGRASVGAHATSVAGAHDDLRQREVASRIWKRDPTVWGKPAADPGLPLGWLSLPAGLPELRREIARVAADIRDRGFTDAVVLGMGGSSLTAAVFSALFDPKPGWLRIHVLDTVSPESVAALKEGSDLTRTVFIVASKSGTTVEPLSLEKHFRSELTAAGVADTASHFVAISDPDTPLANRSAAGEFGWQVTGLPDVGGRYSALSAFGLLPAALMGFDLESLEQPALAMAEQCRRSDGGNPGVWLGALMAQLAVEGRNLVTLITSPGLEQLGLWTEQLLAESTGKGGKGMVPVVSEPHLPMADYGGDRTFVYVRLSGGENASTDPFVSQLEAAGQPLVRINVPDMESISAEFFRWEFATAVAAAHLGVNPFDQPDVEEAKQKARSLTAGGAVADPGSTLEAALESVLRGPTSHGCYVALGAYLPESDELTAAFSRLRKAISQRTKMATMFGYGPRYLHSTGQLHKGGPAGGRLLVITTGNASDVPVPGTTYTLGGLCRAQAAADVEVMKGRGRVAAHATLSGKYVDAINDSAAKLGAKDDQ